MFRRIRTELGIIPLIVFDQFDDYQVAHRGQFLVDGRWIDADRLTASNPAWRRLRDELGHDAFHLLFVTRRDLVAGTEAVRFAPHEILALDRIEPTYIAALLDALTQPGADGKPVVADPDAGWGALKDRLICDLSAQGRVLPIQARVVFRGLTELPYLSTAAYQRRGALGGLEAGYIERAAGSAAAASGLPVARVLDALLTLVDEGDPGLPKARAATEAGLTQAAGASSGQLPRMLDVLRQEGVIRPWLAAGQVDGAGTWSLYHDYLANAVLAARRRAELWQRLLQERLDAFERATGQLARWRALLSPWELVRVVWPTVSGKVRWAG
ncbi:MAG TPA: hypothetical protein VLM84_11970, partial [Chromatiaceae bacterium]|nr:hypothetical protein [Chromatiaceae bacterium]